MIKGARIAMSEQLAVAGNPSSLHAAGRVTRRVLEEARETLAAELGTTPAEILFTSGGTEADNLAVKGLFWARQGQDPRRNLVLVSAVEHHAVLETAQWLAAHQGAELVLVPVQPTGEIDLVALERGIAADPARVALVAVMAANNEVGASNPVAEVASLCARYGIPLHVDAVQAFGSLPVTLGEAATLAISGHKFGAAPGVGALAVSRRTNLTPLLQGGGQERGLRSGTPNVAGAAGMAAAIQWWQEHREVTTARLRVLRERLIAGVTAVDPAATCNSTAPQTLPGIAHFTFPGHRAEAMLMVFDAAGVCVSTGAACSAGVNQPSHVLAAMGQPADLSGSNLRISLGHDSTAEDVAEFLAVLPQALDRSAIRSRVGIRNRVGIRA